MILRTISASFFSTVNKGEMRQFDHISQWWHPSGPMHILYKYNYQRVSFLQKHLNRQSTDPLKPFTNLKILDVGCGAGFLTKSLARLGAQVVGLDPNSTSFKQAMEHKSQFSGELQGLSYFNCTLGEYLSNDTSPIKQFDVVTSMDVIEHVDNPQQFLKEISRAAKEGGRVMVSTIAKNPMTWFTHIVLAQYITKIVPKNTHHYDKFINPNELQEMLIAEGINVVGRRQLELNWRGEFEQKAGGGNYILLGERGRGVGQGK